MIWPAAKPVESGGRRGLMIELQWLRNAGPAFIKPGIQRRVGP